MTKPLKIAFLKDNLDYLSTTDELRTMQDWIGLHVDGQLIEWTITDNPRVVLTERARHDIVLIDYGGTWHHRSYEKGIWLNQMFSPFAEWAENHPGVMVMLVSLYTSHFFEELAEGWHHWPANIFKHEDVEEEGERVQAWVRANKS